MENLRSRTITAVGWVAVQKVVSQAVSIGLGVFLARLLVPDDFGLVAMVVIFSGLAGLLGDVGLGSALIQHKGVTEDHFSSVFWLNLALGCGLSLAFFALSPYIAVFFARPELEGICVAMSASFTIGALGLVPRIRLVKALELKWISLADAISSSAAGMVAVLLAYAGWGYWSLVLQCLLAGLISTVVIWVAGGWRPKVTFSAEAVGDLFSFSAYSFATRVLQYVVGEGDKVLLGKVLGSHALGLYDKAMSFLWIPIANVSHVIAGVMFPSLSAIHSDKKRVKYIYLKTTQAIGLLCFPIFTGLFVVADSFVREVLGVQWIETVPILRILCFSGLIMCIATITGVLFQSQGAAALQFRMNLVLQPLKVIGAIAGLPWGVLGVAFGYAAVGFITSLISVRTAGRLIDVRVTEIVRGLASTLMAAITMAIVVYAVRLLSGLQDGPGLFLMQIIVGIVTYCTLVSVFRVGAYRDILEILVHQVRLIRASRTQQEPVSQPE